MSDLRLEDKLVVIGHAVKPGETLGANGKFIVRRESDGAHIQVLVEKVGKPK